MFVSAHRLALASSRLLAVLLAVGCSTIPEWRSAVGEVDVEGTDYDRALGIGEAF